MDTNNLKLLSPNCALANYSLQRIPQFKGNPLIEALPPAMSDEELLRALTLLPDFHVEQREWPMHERMFMLKELQNFMVPFSRHIELARSIDSLIRSGYVGRAPRTPAHTHIYQNIHDNEIKGVSFSQSSRTHTPQLSTSLIGLSGMGKTTLVKRWVAHLAEVIYHPETHTYQVPYLHIDMPSDGSSIKGLAHGILQKLDQLIPGADYYQEYAIRGRPGAETLMRSVARIMHRHCVGILICDEIQNLANAKKGGQTVMTELVSACNELQVPILFIGTNKASKVLSLDLRQARRSSGHSIRIWDRFPSCVEPGQVDEWREFVQILWKLQWVKNPVELTEQMLTSMYRYSQGIIDIAIKLFASTQARAMLDGSEKISPELIADVYRKELTLLHRPIEALHNGDMEALSEFDDIAPSSSLTGLMEEMSLKLKSQASPLYSIKSTDPTYSTRIAAGLKVMGFSEDDALIAAQNTTNSSQNLTLLEGAKKAINDLTMPTKSPRAKIQKNNAPNIKQTALPSLDYRNAINAAKNSKNLVLQELKNLQLVRPLVDLLELN